MIKINISNEQKEKIEEIIWDDANKSRTGLCKQLEMDKTKIFLRAYPKLYNILYDHNGDINKNEIKKILFSSRDILEKYIEQIGAFDSKSGKKILENVFKFDNFSKRKVIVKLLGKINVEVCPYCNRQYIFTVKSGKARAQLDHYYPKEKYPYLALSVFNLVPCCSLCNVTKLNLDTKKEPILYPYEEEFGYDIYFSIKAHDIKRDYINIVQGISDEFDIVLKNPSKKYLRKVERQMSRLHLTELYDKHKPYIKDLLKNQYINTQERIEEINQMFPQLFNSEEEIKNILYMSAVGKDDWGSRVLAKLTCDIINHAVE